MFSVGCVGRYLFFLSFFSSPETLFSLVFKEKNQEEQEKQQQQPAGYYYRSTGKNMRKEASHFFTSLPSLSSDFSVPNFARSIIFGDKNLEKPEGHAKG